LETLGNEQRWRLNHPTSIKRRWDAAHKVPEAKEPATNARIVLQDQVVKLQEELDMVRKRAGSGFIPSMPVEELAEKFAEHHRPDFLRKLAKELDKIANREERQDKIESTRKRKS